MSKNLFILFLFLALPLAIRSARVAYVPIHKNAGLGHRVSNIVCGYEASLLYNASFFLDKASFSHRSHGTDYRWFLNWLVYDNPKLPKYRERHARMTPGHLHNDTTYEINEKDCWATCNSCYKHALPFMRKMVKGMPPLKNSVYKKNPESTIVAWHFRNGDIELGKDPVMFKRLVDVLGKKKTPDHYFFSERDLIGYEFIKEIVPNATFVTTNVENTLLHFTEADILVGTGSSLVYIVPFLTEKPMIISYPPKEALQGMDAIPFYSTEGIIWYDNFENTLS